MRTTLTIDDDVLAAARDIASRQNKTVGEVISELIRQALRPSFPGNRVRNGVPLLEMQPGATSATMELVNQLRDELP